MNTLGRVFFAFLNINSQSRRSRARIFLLTDRSQEPDRHRPLYLLLLRGISRFTARPPFSRSKFITIHSVIDSLPQNDFSASLVHSLIQAFRLDPKIALTRFGAGVHSFWEARKRVTNTVQLRQFKLRRSPQPRRDPIQAHFDERSDYHPCSAMDPDS